MNGLTKIRDVSSKYSISARTLRYYEDMGLISSIRSNDYAYRLYDDEAMKRLEQILILRKLNISIKDIRRVFTASGSDVVLEVLGNKVNDIDEEVALLHELREIVISFIHQIENADFSKDSDIKLLYDKAKEIETQLINPAPIQRLFEVTEKLEEKAASRMLIPDNILKKRLQNVYFIWGDGVDIAKELGRRHGIFVYHTCDNRWKYEQDAAPKFQPALKRDIPDYFAQDPEDAAQWEREIAHDFTPMAIMDLIELTASHDKIICENALDIDSIIPFVTHAVNIIKSQASDDFYNMYENEIRRRNFPKGEKERFIQKVDALRKKAKQEGGILCRESAKYGVKQIIWDDNYTIKQAVDEIARHFNLTH